MGKWSHLRGRYPAREIAVHEKVSEYELKTTDELEIMVSKLDNNRKALDQAAKDNQINLDSAMQVLLKRWENNGDTQQVKRESIGTLSRADDIYVHVKDLEAFKEWAVENGCDSLIKETVNAKSLSTVIKDLLMEGIAIPESVGIFTKSRIRASNTHNKEAENE